MRVLLFSLIVFILNGCASTSNESNNLHQVVDRFFTVYSQRNDFDGLMSFYADDAKFEDIIYGNSFNNKREIRNFLAWDNGYFKVISGGTALTITKQVIERNTAITTGFFHEFSYDGQNLGPWLFVIIHEFNANNKITKQTDWINYTPRAKFLGGKNMNDSLIGKAL